MGWGAPTHPTMFLIEGTIFRKPRELANELQKYYVDKIKNLVKGLKKGGRDPLRYLDAAFCRWRGNTNLPTFTIREIKELDTLSYIKNFQIHPHLDGTNWMQSQLKSQQDY